MATPERYHAFAYSPLSDDSGAIRGHLCVVTEETERLLGEPRLAMLRALAVAEIDRVKTTFFSNVSHELRTPLTFVLGPLAELEIRVPRLVRSAEPQVDAGRDPSTLAVHANAPRVLIVDDNEDAAFMIAEMLQLYGYDTRFAHDGPSALTTALEFRPQVAIFDIGLPVMDGFELARRFGEHADLRALADRRLLGQGSQGRFVGVHARQDERTLLSDDPLSRLRHQSQPRPLGEPIGHARRQRDGAPLPAARRTRLEHHAVRALEQ